MQKVKTDVHSYIFSFQFFSDTLLFLSRATPGRIGKSHSSGRLDDPDDEQYEYMNKQTPVSPRPSSYNLKPFQKRTSSISSQMTVCSGDTSSSLEMRGGHMKSKDNSDSEQQGSNDVEYEYMDIRGSDKYEKPPAHDPPLPPSLARIGDRDLGDEEDEYVEDSNYHYTNRQPKLRKALQDSKDLKIQGRDEGEADEYEDMDCFAARRTGDTVVYQNVQKEGEGAVGVSEVHRPGFDSYLKVQAGVGVGEPAAGDRSFDNPDYWHSRMFLKSEAVPT